MKMKLKKLRVAHLFILAAIPFIYNIHVVYAQEVASEGWDETRSVYYVNQDDKLVKADGVVKVDQDYLYFEDGVLQSGYTGIKKIEDEDTFEVYYIENGKALLNSWNIVNEKKGNFKYYFGSNGKAYKADGINGMRTTKVKIKTVDGKKYGFDENGHNVTGLWSTEKKLVFFNTKTGVYNDKKSVKYQKVVKRGKKSTKMIKTIKKKFGKPKKIKKTSSCNPFDLKSGEVISSSTLKRYKGYNYIYQNIVISMTKNTQTGVYYMEGAGPIDLD